MYKIQFLFILKPIYSIGGREGNNLGHIRRYYNAKTHPDAVEEAQTSIYKKSIATIYPLKDNISNSLISRPQTREYLIFQQPIKSALDSGNNTPKSLILEPQTPKELTPQDLMIIFYYSRDSTPNSLIN